MSEFNTNTRKIRQTWRRIQKNINELRNKDNFDEFEFFINLLKQQHLKTPLEVFNSGEIIVKAEFTGSTPFKNSLFTTEISYAQNIELEIPEILLPFIKYSIEVNPIPDTEIHGLFALDNYEFVGDDVEIRGDGTLIFKSDNLPTGNTTIGGSSQFVFPDSFFTDNNISFDLSKDVFKGTIVKNDDSIETGNITTINTVFDTGNVNCNLTNDIETFRVNPFITPGHKIISITSTGFTATGELTLDTFSGGGCVPEQIITDNVTKTITFGLLDSYQIAFDLGILIDSSDIKTQEFEENGNWLFWSTLKQRVFELVVFGSDGDFKEISPTNFPDTSLGDTLLYTSITLKRNIVNEIIIEKTDDFQGIINSEREFKTYVTTSTSNASIPTNRFNLNGSFILVSRATKESEITVDFPVYDDIYTVVGTTYSLTTEDHSILAKETWTGANTDITLTIKGHLVNPLYWREQRRYTKNDV